MWLVPTLAASRQAVLEALPLAAVSLQRRAALRALAPDYSRDPVGHITTRLGAHLWSKQIEIAQAVRDHRRVAVHSAHATGKSFLAARLVAWWLDSRPPGDAFVVSTAPTASQVRAILWREIGRAYRSAALPGRVNQTEWWMAGSERYQHPRAGEEMVAIGRKPSDYDESAFQGIHAREVLVVIDEAAGVPKRIYDAAGSLAANEHSRILAIGNPDDPSSHFAAICRPGSGWHVIHVDGLESPGFTGEPVPDTLRDLLLSPLYAAELAEEAGGIDSPLYSAKVRGLFPEDASDGVVLLSWVRACQRLELEPGTPVELGVDVGAGGDETVIRERRGPVAGRTWGKRTPDWADGVALVLDAIDETGATCVKVDSIGIGWGMVGRLRELAGSRHHAEIVAVNVGEAATDPAKFPKLRDQLWWEIGRELSRTGGWDLSAVDEKTIAQLTAPQYHRDSAGRIKVEPKAETRKRLKRSPDDADAILLAYATIDRGGAHRLDGDLVAMLSGYRGL